MAFYKTGDAIEPPKKYVPKKKDAGDDEDDDEDGETNRFHALGRIMAEGVRGNIRKRRFVRFHTPIRQLPELDENPK